MKRTKNLGIVLLSLLILPVLMSCKGSARYFKDVVDNKTLNSAVVDGVPLNHKAETTLQEKYSYGSLELEEGSLFAELSGMPEQKVDLKVSYLEFQPGDATLSLSDGKIMAESKSGNPVAITRVSGSIPENLSLDMELGTGSVKLSKLKGSPAVEVDTGTGSVILTDCSLDKLEAQTGTGSVSLTRCQINSAEIESGTGDIILEKSQVSKREFSSGTGKVIEK